MWVELYHLKIADLKVGCPLSSPQFAIVIQVYKLGQDKAQLISPHTQADVDVITRSAVEAE